MVDTVKEAPVWPVNNNGEIVMQSGTGDATIVGYIPSSGVPMDTTTNKVVVKMPDETASVVSDTEGWPAVKSSNSVAITLNSTRNKRLTAMLSAYSSNLKSAPLDNAVMSNPPTVTKYTTDISTTHGVLPPFKQSFPYFTGTNSTLYTLNFGLPYQRGEFVCCAGNQNEFGVVVPFMSDVSICTLEKNVAFKFYGSTNFVRFRVREPGQPDMYVNKAGHQLSNTTYCFIVLAFATAADREITVEMSQNDAVCVYMQPSGALTAPARDGKAKVCLDGDSFFLGAQGTFTPGTHYYQDGIPGYIRDYLGANVFNNSRGGTGWHYVSVGGGLPLDDATRVANIPLNTDVLVCQGCINEAYFNIANLSTLQAAVTSGLALRRARLPGVPIVLITTFKYPNGGTNTGLVEAAAKAGAEALNDPLIFVVPTYAIAKSWISGDGSSGRITTGQVTFNAPLVAATTGTQIVKVACLYQTDYVLIFSDGTVKTGVTLDANNFAISWTGGVTDNSANPVATFYSNTRSGNSDYIIGADVLHPLVGIGCSRLGKLICDAAINAVGGAVTS